MAAPYLGAMEKPDQIVVNRHLLDGIVRAEGAELQQRLMYLDVLEERGNPWLPHVLAVAVRSIPEDEHARAFLAELESIPGDDDPLRTWLTTAPSPVKILMLWRDARRSDVAAFVLGEAEESAPSPQKHLRQRVSEEPADVDELLRLLYVLRRVRPDHMAAVVRSWGWSWYRSRGSRVFVSLGLNTMFLHTLSELEQDAHTFAMDVHRVGLWCHWMGPEYSSFMNDLFGARGLVPTDGVKAARRLLESDDLDDNLAGVVTCSSNVLYTTDCRSELDCIRATLEMAPIRDSRRGELYTMLSYTLALKGDEESLDRVNHVLELDPRDEEYELNAGPLLAKIIVERHQTKSVPKTLLTALSRRAVAQLVESADDARKPFFRASVGRTHERPASVLEGIARGPDTLAAHCRSALLEWGTAMQDSRPMRELVLGFLRSCPVPACVETHPAEPVEDASLSSLVAALRLLESLGVRKTALVAAVVRDVGPAVLDVVLVRDDGDTIDALELVLTALSRAKDDRDRVLASIRDLGVAAGRFLAPDRPAVVQERARRLQLHCTRLLGERFAEADRTNRDG